MHYTILCYNQESGTTWPRESEAQVMAELGAITAKLTREGKLVMSARLDRTTSAATLRKSPVDHLLLDGPFAETKEQLLGFYVVACASKEEAVGIARELAAAVPVGAYEIRPILTFQGDARST